MVINYKVWSLGDRMHKFAHEAYGDSELWWVLAWFNQKPTDAHYKIGDKIAIPHPIEDLVSLYCKNRSYSSNCKKTDTSVNSSKCRRKGFRSSTDSWYTTRLMIYHTVDRETR